jgi:hypothetical protein
VKYKAHLKILFVGFSLCGWVLISGLNAHPPPTTQTKGAARRHSGTSILSTNDSIPLAIDVYGHLTNSWAEKWYGGVPLGTGGRPSLFYNTELFREASWLRATE